MKRHLDTLLLDTWERLTEVTTLRFKARSHSAYGWNGQGEGLVTISKPNPNALIFTETGDWQPQTKDAKKLSFNNIYRWSIDQSKHLIRLEHLRFGSQNPVHLVDLSTDHNGHWQSVSPHQCNRDFYSASLTITSAEIELNWTIKGPNKDEYIQYWYS